MIIFNHRQDGLIPNIFNLRIKAPNQVVQQLITFVVAAESLYGPRCTRYTTMVSVCTSIHRHNLLHVVFECINIGYLCSPPRLIFKSFSCVAFCFEVYRYVSNTKMMLGMWQHNVNCSSKPLHSYI